MPDPKHPTAKKIADLLATRLVGSDFAITSLSAFPNRAEESISFLTGPLSGSLKPAVAKAAVLARAQFCDSLVAAGYTVIISERPKYDLALIWRQLIVRHKPASIHPTAVIGASVQLGADVSIGAHAVLDGEIIVGDGCRIGHSSTLVNVIIIGRDVHIRNGTVIGEDAFSFGFSEDGKVHGDAIRFPSIGGVIIGDGVEIGNNCVIARGIFDDTVIGENAKINDFAHLGNSVRVGPCSMIMAKTDISGRVEIGEGAFIGQSAAIRQGTRIGRFAQIGMGAVVTRDVEDGVVAFGSPAKPQRLRGDD